MSNAVRMYDERVAFWSLEQSVWPDGPVCPHCREAGKLGRLNGVRTPIGTWKCYSCRKPFTARHGTVMHNSHVPTHIWLQSLYLLTATNRKMGSQTLGQIIGVSVRTAWQLKLKITAALDDESDRDGVVGLRRLDKVVRYPLSDEAQPGRASCATRYKRFLAAVEGLASEEIDQQFLVSLSRLLGRRPKSFTFTAESLDEQQLELGLFSDEACQMAAEGCCSHGTSQPKA